MKKLLFVLSFIALSAHAEMITQGGFGTDGATGQSIPTNASVTQANTIYKALDVAPSSFKGKKTVAIEDESQFECEEPKRGISRVSGGCMFVLRASQKAKVAYGPGLSGDVKFEGALAEALFKKLNVRAVVRAGATTKTVENLSCFLEVARKTTYKCVLVDTNVMQMDIPLPR